MAERNAFLGDYEFNPYAAGVKRYGSVKNSPNIGAVDKTGYAERDMKKKARKAALANARKANSFGSFAGPMAMKGGM